MSSMEVEMRVFVAALGGFATLAAVSVQAAPLAPTKATPAELPRKRVVVPFSSTKIQA